MGMGVGWHDVTHGLPTTNTKLNSNHWPLFPIKAKTRLHAANVNQITSHSAQSKPRQSLRKADAIQITGNSSQSKPNQACINLSTILSQLTLAYQSPDNSA